MKKIFLAACMAGLAGWPDAPRAEIRLEQQAWKMGMRVSVQVWVREKRVGNLALRAAFQELDRLNQAYSFYVPESEVSRINRSKPRTPIPVSEETAGLLLQARHWSERTGGAFDITSASLAELYGLDTGRFRVPDNGELARVLPRVNYRYLRLSGPASSLELERPGMKIDLGGLAKSHALNRVQAVLETFALKAALVNAGGDVMLLGSKPDGQPWNIAVRHPRNPGQVLARLALPPGKLLSSGDYALGWNENRTRYHHILDARTGRPARYAMAATLYLPAAPKEDLPSIVLMLLPPPQAVRWVQRIPGAEALIVDSSGRIWTTPGWRSLPGLDLQLPLSSEDPPVEKP